MLWHKIHTKNKVKHFRIELRCSEMRWHIEYLPTIIYMALDTLTDRMKWSEVCAYANACMSAMVGGFFGVR